MAVEKALHTRQSTIYTTKHLFCIQRFNERTSFTISRSFIVVTVLLHWSPILHITGLLQYYIRLGAAPCGPSSAQTPGPQLQVQVSSVHRSRCPPAANQRPVMASGDQSEGGEWPGPGIREPSGCSRPAQAGSVLALMVSVTTLQKLSGSECGDTCSAPAPNTYWIVENRAHFECVMMDIFWCWGIFYSDVPSVILRVSARRVRLGRGAL